MNTVSELEAFVDGFKKEMSASATEYNELVDKYEELRTQNYLLQSRLNELEQQRKLDKSQSHNMLVANGSLSEALKAEKAQRRIKDSELRELRKLDPRRLLKVNKEQKKRISELKGTLTKSEAERKNALKQHKIMFAKQQDSGLLDSWVCPETGNALRIVGTLKISKTNEFGGVPETPVIEFFHKGRGITRQGSLCGDGKVGWATATNSTPSLSESAVAKELILSFCEKQRIRIPKGI